MTLFKKFADSELSPEEEERYLNKIHEKHYDKNLSSKYSKLLEEEHGVMRGAGVTNTGKPTSKYRRLLFGSILAVAACGLFAFYFLGGIGNGLINQTDRYLTASVYQNQESLRGDIRSDALRNEAVLAYNSGEMSKALENYKLLENKTESDFFFEGMAYMYNNEFKKAIANFEGITNDAFKYKEEIKWFKALCYIKSDQKESAISELKSLKSWKQEEAASLIELLNK